MHLTCSAMDMDSCPLSIPESAERVEVKEDPLVVWPGGCSEPVTMRGELPSGEHFGTVPFDRGLAEGDTFEGDFLAADLSLATLFKQGGRATWRDCWWCPEGPNLPAPVLP